MKRSKLTLTGETYRLTPAGWGETNIMVDEELVTQAQADSMGVDIEECDPDGDPNDRPEKVDIATDKEGNFYAILHPYEMTSWGHKTGKMANENLFRQCEPINSELTFGAAVLYGNKWEQFEEEA